MAKDKSKKRTTSREERNTTRSSNRRSTRPGREKPEQTTSTRIITQPCRSSYMFVIEPRENDDGDEVYSSQIIIPKKDKVTLRKIKAAIELAAKAKFGAKVKMGQLKTPLRDADEEERDGDEYDNSYFLNANNNRRPGAVDRSNTKLVGDECFEHLYSGAWFRFSLTFYGFDNRGNKGVAVALNNVMFHKHDDRLDGSVAAESEFEDYGEDDDDSDDSFDDDNGGMFDD